MTSQNGAMEPHMSAQKMCFYRMEALAVMVATAMKKDVTAMTNSAGDFLARMPGKHPTVATRKSTLMVIVLVTVE